MIRAIFNCVSISEVSTWRVKSQALGITFFGLEMVGPRSYLCVPKLVQRIILAEERTVSTFKVVR